MEGEIESMTQLCRLRRLSRGQQDGLGEDVGIRRTRSNHLNEQGVQDDLGPRGVSGGVCGGVSSNLQYGSEDAILSFASMKRRAARVAGSMTDGLPIGTIPESNVSSLFLLDPLRHTRGTADDRERPLLPIASLSRSRFSFICSSETLK